MQSASVLQRCLARAAAVSEPDYLPCCRRCCYSLPSGNRSSAVRSLSTYRLTTAFILQRSPGKDVHVLGVCLSCQRAVEQQQIGGHTNAAAMAAAGVRAYMTKAAAAAATHQRCQASCSTAQGAHRSNLSGW